ncbi:MAG: stage II sporulation protein M [Candidatus Aenigmarchaeota archaeon]|nr:stage II sporulation protein M [Candidatus Aenigmarchaeota archaeon]
MVVEKIISVRKATKNIIWVFLASGFISVFCLAIALLVFRTSTGLFTTMLITIVSIPFMHSLLKAHEAKQEELWIKELSLIQRHKKIIEVYIAFFLGIVLTMSIIFVMLPPQVAEGMFEEQIREIELIRGKIIFASTFQMVITNNLTVLALSFLLAFLISAGAIFVLTWNALVLSTAIGLAAKSIAGLPTAILTFLPHGSLEFLAYFLAVISGGILSAAITRRESKRFWFVFQDCMLLLLLGVWLIIFAAFIEAFAIL